MDTVTQDFIGQTHDITVHRHFTYTLNGNTEYAHVFAAPSAPMPELVPAGAVDVRELTEAELEAEFAAVQRKQELLDALRMLDAKYFNNEATRVNAMFGDETALSILQERRDAHEAEAAPLRAELAGLGV